MWRLAGIEKYTTHQNVHRGKPDADALTGERADALIDEAGRGFGLNRSSSPRYRSNRVR